MRKGHSLRRVENHCSVLYLYLFFSWLALMALESLPCLVCVFCFVLLRVHGGLQ